jgi:CRISPR-associated protein Csd1
MILQALNAYYERLQADPDSDIAPIGYSRQKIAFSVTLNQDGSLHDIEDVRKQGDKKLIPQSLVVPGNAKSPGAGINPGFLWDNPAYLLGYKADDPKPERTQQSFEAFRQRHLGAEEAISDPHFSAVCRFLETWDPGDATRYPKLIEIGTGFGVFRIRAQEGYVHERPAVTQWWNAEQADNVDDKGSASGQCLVTGEYGLLARLHEPKIKGVWGAQSAGAALVSFNLDAFDSYGKSQGVNCPVSESAAFQYCTALNRLLAANSKQRLQIGDATTVFWTEKPTEAENLLPWILEPSKEAEDESLKNRLGSILDRIRQGYYPDELGEKDTRFCILGLSPNAARISVRFWYISNLGQLIENLNQHFSDLEIIRGPKDIGFPAVWQLVRETVRESKDVPPLLAGTLVRSILTGAPYPQMLYMAVLRRIRADRELRHLRAAVLKAHLNRNHRLGVDILEKEISMALDPERSEPAYHLGRLFAELEKTQEDALPDLNATIKDRYFGSASATPGSVFPRLIRLSQHHLGKLERNKKTYHEKRIQEIAGRLDGFASHMSLKDQGLFAIGYYHQRQDIFTKKTNKSDSDIIEKE